jgi:hypothetical protein
MLYMQFGSHALARNGQAEQGRSAAMLPGGNKMIVSLVEPNLNKNSHRRRAENLTWLR